jgi:two-component system, cell cycle response regulator CpdR
MARAFTILLVDDDDLARESLNRLLEAHGCRVLVAASAVEALRILAQEPVDALLTDIIMPDQDGIELAKEAKALRPDLHVMFATGYYSRAAEASGLGALLFKPIRDRELGAILASVRPSER